MNFLEETIEIAGQIDPEPIEQIATRLAQTRIAPIRGRLFIVGLGGGYAHALHAAADFRNLCGIDAYTPDNGAELTADINDFGWDDWLVRWLDKFKPIQDIDTLMVFSVGGGDTRNHISTPIVNLLVRARIKQMFICGIVGRDGGSVKAMGNAVVMIPPLFPEHITAHTEGFQSVVAHALVFHPALNLMAGKWERTDARAR